MKKSLVLISVFAMFAMLSMCGAASGATYFVRTDGSDLNNGSADNAANAFATIQHAIDTVASGNTISISAGTYNETKYNYISIDSSNANGKTLTITGVGSVIISVSSGDYCVVVGDTTGACTLTWSNIIFESTTSNVAKEPKLLRLQAANTNGTFTFTNCTFRPHANNTYTIPIQIDDATGTSTRTLTLNNCTLTSKGGEQAVLATDLAAFNVNGGTYSGVAEVCMQLKDIAAITLNGGSYSVTTDKKVIYVLGALGSILVKNGASFSQPSGISTPAITNHLTPSITALTKVEVYDSHFTNGAGVNFACYSGVNYEFYAHRNTFTGVAGGIGVGSNTTDLINAIKWYSICYNTVVNGAAGHGIFAGVTGATTDTIANVVGGEIIGNYSNATVGADYGIVCKTSGAHIEDNVAIGKYGMCIKGVQGGIVRNNTCIGFDSGGDGCGLYLIAQPVLGGNPQKLNRHTSFRNNIFYSTGEHAVLTNTDTTGWYDLMFDYNCYYSTSTANLINDNGGMKSFSEWKIWWAANGTNELSKSNDVHSVNINPNLDSNYKPKARALQNTGSPSLLKSDGTVLERNSIGAGWKTGSSSPFSRTRRVIGN